MLRYEALKFLLDFGLSKIDPIDYEREYLEGERYVANCSSCLDGTFFRSKKEAIEYWRMNIKQLKNEEEI